MTSASAHRQYLPVALIVDSDPDTTEMYAAALSLEGFTTVEAQAADQVWHWVQVAPPTIVITDLKLDGAMDGVGFIRQLRQSEGTRRVPIVVVSASTAPQSVEAAVRAGCDAFLAKPCPPDELGCKVLALVSRPEP